MAHRLDILAAWKDKIIFHSMPDRILGLVDLKGKILDTRSFVPPAKYSSIHSISTTPDEVYCFDLNGHTVLATDFRHELSIKDRLDKDCGGAVVNDKKGYTFLQFHPDSSRTTLFDSLPGSYFHPIFTMEKMYDFGFSHFGQLIKSFDGRTFIYTPFYNARIIRYDYPSAQTTIIQTIEKTPVTDHTIDVAKTKMLSSKVPVINRKATANSKWLFVLSYARTTHDDQDTEIVDVYDIHSGKYATSLHVPGLQKGNITGMTCNENKFIASFKNQLIIYDIYEN